YHYARQSNLLGLGPVNQRRDPGLQIDGAFADPAANLTILPVAQGGEAPHEYLDVQITFGAPPMIVRQPESQIALEGQPAEFTIQVTVPPDTHFLWQRKIGGTGEWVGLTDGGSVSGSSSPTLLINPVSLGMGGDAFRCVLSNSAGGFNCSRAVNLAVSSFGVSTLAGQAGVQGAADGPVKLAQFNSPQGVAVDNGGNVYVADTGNQVIRKIQPGGTVTTLAGSAGSAGSDDGMGNAARFNSPAGIAVDAAGTLYVADQLNSTIRKITVDGLVTTLAGSAGQSGSQDGHGALARFNHPCAIAVDCFGNLYVADTGNNSIREISADGTVTTVAGATGIAGALDGPTGQASFDRPSGIAVDFDGLVYVSDQGNSTIRRIVPGGSVTTLAGAAHTPGFMDGLNANARFSLPAGLAVDASGILYVADPNNSTIRQINPSGVVSTVAGVAGTNGVSDGSCSDATFSFPAAVAVDGLGMLYVADTVAETIRLIRAAPPQPPVLHIRAIRDQLVLSWPASAAGFVLETAQDISAAGRWEPVLGAPTAFGCNLFWTNQLPGKLGFFRLHQK
ncbi:MAG TPA: hypothetical protein VKY92_27890, partial [Verrucomicrobiae bacterium]|nr:hypothetical protein [Verrucomicrobiae bacterium]